MLHDGGYASDAAMPANCAAGLPHNMRAPRKIQFGSEPN